MDKKAETHVLSVEHGVECQAQHWAYIDDPQIWNISTLLIAYLDARCVVFLALLWQHQEVAFTTTKLGIHDTKGKGNEVKGRKKMS